MEVESIDALVRAVAEGRVKELEAERLLNAITRLNANVPTGTTKPHTTDTH